LIVGKLVLKYYAFFNYVVYKYQQVAKYALFFKLLFIDPYGGVS